MKIDKKNIMPVAVLGSICIVVAFLMGLVNMITSPIIREADEKAVKESLSIVMPNGEFNARADELKDGAPKTINAIYTDKNGLGYVAVLTTTKGYTGKAIGITVAFDKDGKIIKAVVTKNEESIVPAELKAGGTYGDKYIGVNAKDVASLVTGATVKFTESAIKGAINDASAYLGFIAASDNTNTNDSNVKGNSALTDSDVIAIAGELMPGSYEKHTVDGMPEQVLGVYRETTGKGYAVHIATRTQYRDLETDGVVTVNAFGEITGVKMVEWIVGYDSTLLPSAPECDEAFLNSIKGKNSAGLKRVDLVTHATNTSNNFINPLKEAMDILYPVPIYTVATCSVIAAFMLFAVSYLIYIKVKGGKKNEE